MKMMQVTPSKQWIHFFLSDLWPPTSNILQGNRRFIVPFVAPHRDSAALCFTWSWGLWRKTGSRWYRWFLLGIAARPARWAHNRAGSVAPGHSGSCREEEWRYHDRLGLQELQKGHPLLSGRVVELVLGGPVEARLDARVFPQAEDDVRQLFRHGALFDGVCKMHELSGVVL